MAITRGASTLAEGASGTTLTGTLPTVSTGDYVVAVFGTSDTAANFTAPSGWTQLVAPFAFTTGRTLAAYIKKDPTANPVATTVTSGRWTVECVAYSGVDGTTPIDVAAVTATATATPVAVGSITTVTNGAVLVGGCAADVATSGTITCPATMTQIQESSGTGRRTEVADETFATAGATGTRTWTLSAGALAMGAFTAALRPAAGGTNATATPTLVAPPVVTIGTPTITASSTPTPSTVAPPVVSIPTPTIHTDSTATPATVTAVVSVPTPTVSVPVNATATPATVTGAVSIPTPTAGPTSPWFLWDNLHEIPITLAGRWNGATVDALTFDQVTP